MVILHARCLTINDRTCGRYDPTIEHVRVNVAVKLVTNTNQ